MYKLFFIFPVIFISAALFSQQHPLRLMKDQRTGCGVYETRFSTGHTITWSGRCRDSLATGKGILTWRLNDLEVARYEGYMLNGRPHGRGKYNYGEGILLEGNFADGEFFDLSPECLRLVRKNAIKDIDTSNNYVGDLDSRELFYYSIIPAGKVKGVLVLIDGTWETAEHNLSSNRELCRIAVDSGLAVIVPSVNQRLVMDTAVLSLLNSFFGDAILKYKLPKDKFVLGGFSMGGFFSLRYAAMAMEDSTRTAVKPKAVFSVDGPTDLANLHAKWNNDLLNPRNPNKTEPAYALNELESHIGGSPAAFYERYVYYSVYSRSEPDGGTARYFTDFPFRIYNDVDVNWWIANRGVDLYGMNALNQSAMVNLLRGLGNTKAEFINAFGKGYRIEGFRHPHSWSIVDPADCIKWMMPYLR
jgi:hypothetical protein